MISAVTITLAFLGLLIVPLFAWGMRKQYKRSHVLLNFLNARYIWPFGTIEFNYSGIVFRIMRVASGRGASDVGGSYPVLWAYVRPCSKMILGHAESGQFSLGKFLILPPHIVSKIEAVDFLVGTVDLESCERIKGQFAADPILAKKLPILFDKKFARLTISTEIHVGDNSLFQKKYVLRYYGLSEEIYEDPKCLELKLKLIFEIMRLFGLEFETSLTPRRT